MARMVLAMVLAALTVPAAAQVLSDVVEGTAVLEMDHIGPIKLGMNKEKLERVLHQAIPYDQFLNRGCSAFSTQDLAPRGLSFLMDRNRLVRINLDYYGTDTRPLKYKTAAGIGLGTTEAELLKAYPKAEVKANPADPTWHTVSAQTPDESMAIVFETDGKTVKSIRAGENPAVAYANWCN